MMRIVSSKPLLHLLVLASALQCVQCIEAFFVPSGAKRRPAALQRSPVVVFVAGQQQQQGWSSSGGYKHDDVAGAAANNANAASSVEKPIARSSTEENEYDAMVSALFNRCESEYFMHRLAAEYFDHRNFWLLFLPATFLTMLGGILAFMTTTDLVRNADPMVNEVMTVVVGALSVISVFFQNLMHQLKYGVRAEMHASAAIELKKISDDLEFQIVKEIRGNSHVVVERFQQRYSQVMNGCKSTLPVELSQAFKSLDNHILMRYPEMQHNDIVKLEKLISMAYNELYCGFTKDPLWPMVAPKAGTVIFDALSKVEPLVDQKESTKREIEMLLM